MSQQSDLHKLIAEYQRRVASGELLDGDRFVRDHPDYAEQLRPLLDATVPLSLRLERDVTVEPRLSAADAEDADDVADETLVHVSPTVTYDPAVHASDTLDADAPSGGNAPDLSARIQLPCWFGNYQLLQIIGRGGMGVVFKAREIELDRIVAVKMIRSGRLAGEEDVRRFYAEAQAAARLAHPNIVTIYRVGEIDGHHFFAMDYVEGTDLQQMLQQGSLPADRAARYLRDIAEAIHFAHSNGILHRDLKPANILIDRDDRPHISDFGLAKQLDQDSGLTASGTALGTPSYMPPEQAAGRTEQIGRPSDVYALGAILYVMLTGQPPFQGDSVLDTILEVLHKHPALPRRINPLADQDLETICLKCLHKDPQQRYATAQELADDLRRVLDAEPITARPLPRWKHATSWTRNIPLVAALTGRRFAEPTVWHQRAQLAMLLAPLLILAMLFAWSRLPQPLPHTVRVAGGVEGGFYHELAHAISERLKPRLARQMEVVPTAGSLANRSALLARQVDLALLQADAVSSHELAVVAPLYYELAFVLARPDRGIHGVADLAGKAVALGPEGSGMRESSLKILQFYQIDADQLKRTTASFQRLADDPALDAAIVVAGSSSRGLGQLLQNTDLTLIPIGDAEQLARRHSSFKSTHLYPKDVDSSWRHKVPADGLATLMVPAFLVTRSDAPDALVTAALQALYEPSGAASRHGLLSREEASGWTALPRHPAAERYFQALAP